MFNGVQYLAGTSSKVRITNHKLRLKVPLRSRSGDAVLSLYSSSTPTEVNLAEYLKDVGSTSRLQQKRKLNTRSEPRGTMKATDAMFHLDAVARSIPEPVLPPNALNSQISEILRATRPFLNTDRDRILQNIVVLEQQLSVYDALLNRIDEVRLEMQSHRDAIHKSVVAYSSTLTPIRRLPSDILRSVFLEVQIWLWWNPEHSKSNSVSGPVLEFSQGPWKLSHVCGAWRGIVLSYPQLWSCIVLQFGRSNGPVTTLRRKVPALQAAILRSAQHPLDIVFKLWTVRCAGAEITANEDAAVQACPVILEESYRWRSIDANLSITLLEQLKVVHGKIPCLESLTLKTSHYPYFSAEDLPEDVRRVFTDAPRLQMVILHLTRGPNGFMLSLHITHLATFMGKVSDVEAYQSLVECHLAIKEERSPDVSPPHPIHLPNVRRLCIVAGSAFAAAPTFLRGSDDFKWPQYPV